MVSVSLRVKVVESFRVVVSGWVEDAGIYRVSVLEGVEAGVVDDRPPLHPGGWCFSLQADDWYALNNLLLRNLFYNCFPKYFTQSLCTGTRKGFYCFCFFF